jgi:hypothetical protein
MKLRTPNILSRGFVAFRPRTSSTMNCISLTRFYNMGGRLLNLLPFFLQCHEVAQGPEDDCGNQGLVPAIGEKKAITFKEAGRQMLK